MALCESCAHYCFDDEYEYYYCDVNLDEDDMARFITGNLENCHFFQLYDEYKIVEKQN